MTPCCDITISDAGSTLKLGPFASHGEFSFTCRNLLGRSFPGLVEVLGVAEGGGSNSLPSWISADAKQEFDLDATLVVAVRAQLPSGSPAQRVKLKLRVSNELSPNEEYAESRVVTVEVESAKPQAPPKWLIPVLALCCALIALGGAAVWFFSGSKTLALGDACTSADAKCPQDSSCQKGHCLARDGIRCLKPEQCESGACTASTCTKALLPPALRLGDACDASRALCPDGTSCSAEKKKCLRPLGQPCDGHEAECESERCGVAGRCIAAPGDTCNTDHPCKDGQNCVNGTCKLKARETCRSDADCNLACGQNGRCMLDDGSCTLAEECQKSRSCLAGHCLIRQGDPCDTALGGSQCEGGFCATAGADSPKCAKDACGGCEGGKQCSESERRCLLKLLSPCQNRDMCIEHNCVNGQCESDDFFPGPGVPKHGG